MPPKTVIEKTESPAPEVTIFKISGTLGFHEKSTLEKLFAECNKRNMHRVVLDMEGVTSLGGGCAQILREQATTGGFVIGIAGAKKTAIRFLVKEPVEGILVLDDLESAVREVCITEPGAPSQAPADEPMVEPDDELVSDATLDEVLASDDDAAEDAAEADAGAEKVAGAPDASELADAPEPEPAPEPEKAPEPEPAKAAATKSAGRKEAETPDPPVQEPDTPADSPAVAAKGADGDESKELRKRIVQYNTVFTVNSDFHGIQDRKSLLELLLLTTIAQVGVESAVFLEHNDGYFIPAATKGIEADEVRGFAVSGESLGLDEWGKTREVYAIEKAPVGDDVKAPLLSLGCSYLAPFIVHGIFRGVMLLGKPIKSDLDDSTIEMLKMLINQAALAYGSMAKFEAENERTLGLVRTLISLIEENTLARGNTDLISNYVYALGHKLHYPDEHIRDLMYGTMLRDIGMIKVSDLIVRSPRELMPEEWEIIKRHPIDGAEMMRNMSFSEHAVNIVLAHHERFNGEGYPNGTQGQDIPLGARVVSVVESYAAMLQERPTRPALTQEEALNTLRENWGMRYDPDVVKHFVELVENEVRSGSSLAEKRFELFSV